MCGTMQVDWYTKRAGLAAVYTSTELYMLQDDSREFENTWNFLDRQLTCCVWIGHTASEVMTIFSFHQHMTVLAFSICSVSVIVTFIFWKTVFVGCIFDKNVLYCS